MVAGLEDERLGPTPGQRADGRVGKPDPFDANGVTTRIEIVKSEPAVCIGASSRGACLKDDCGLAKSCSAHRTHNTSFDAAFLSWTDFAACLGEGQSEAERPKEARGKGIGLFLQATSILDSIARKVGDRVPKFSLTKSLSGFDRSEENPRSGILRNVSLPISSRRQSGIR